MKMKVLVLITVAVVVAASPAWALTIVDSKHDLSSGSSATTKSNVNEICVFCHTPHSANQTVAPLWNRLQDTTSTFTPYTSSTMGVSPGQPSGVSLACLSCHDGQLGLDQLYNYPNDTSYDTMGEITFSGDVTGSDPEKLATDADGYMGTDLSDDHPVSFVYNTAYTADTTGLRTAVAGNPVTVDNASVKVNLSGNSIATATLECSSCHDPHDNANEPFLVMDNSPSSGDGSPLCLTCHNK